MATPAVELTKVSRRFGDVPALNEINLSVMRGEFFSLLGPSGCGKTTLLRIIAGLDLPDTGNLRIGSEDATHIPAHKRPVNTVFQSYALFPHLSVEENVAFGLRMKNVPRGEIKDRVAKMMDIVQIGKLANRRPAQLSGGQKQRVALARAIVNEPQVLLLDEPLGALDLKLRKQLQIELHALQRRLGITFIYVTHDQDEALTMSDRIAVMNNGNIEQLDRAAEIYEFPRTRFVAQFLGSCNLIEARVHAKDGRTAILKTSVGDLRAEINPTARRIACGDTCTLAIRPEKIHLMGCTGVAENNCFSARVTDFVYSGSETQYSLDVSGTPLQARILNTRVSQAAIPVGQEVSVALPCSGLVLLDD